MGHGRVRVDRHETRAENLRGFVVHNLTMELMEPRDVPGRQERQRHGWRPIVLANTVGKLVEKVVAQELQTHRQAYPLHSRAPAHLNWSRQATRGLTYLVTDKGPR